MTEWGIVRNRRLGNRRIRSWLILSMVEVIFDPVERFSGGHLTPDFVVTGSCWDFSRDLVDRVVHFLAMY